MKKFLVVPMVLCLLLSSANAYSDYSAVPPWVKNTAKWWSQGQVGDADFVKGMQYLIQKGILEVDVKPGSNTTSLRGQIPSWVRTTAGWWAEGKVGDQDFLRGIQYLVDAKIMKLTTPFSVSSPVFLNYGKIPPEYTCDGNETSPPLAVSGVPLNSDSLVLTVVDIDAPSGPFTHWIMWNIPANVTDLSKGQRFSFPQGTTSAGTQGYFGPCPPHGLHRYVFTLYALDTILNLDSSATRNQLEQAMDGHVIAATKLVGMYEQG